VDRDGAGGLALEQEVVERDGDGQRGRRGVVDLEASAAADVHGAAHAIAHDVGLDVRVVAGRRGREQDLDVVVGLAARSGEVVAAAVIAAVVAATAAVAPAQRQRRPGGVLAGLGVADRAQIAQLDPRLVDVRTVRIAAQGAGQDRVAAEGQAQPGGARGGVAAGIGAAVLDRRPTAVHVVGRIRRRSARSTPHHQHDGKNSGSHPFSAVEPSKSSAIIIEQYPAPVERRLCRSDTLVRQPYNHTHRAVCPTSSRPSRTRPRPSPTRSRASGCSSRSIPAPPPRRARASCRWPTAERSPSAARGWRPSRSTASESLACTHALRGRARGSVSRTWPAATARGSTGSASTARSSWPRATTSRSGRSRSWSASAAARPAAPCSTRSVTSTSDLAPRPTAPRATTAARRC